MIWQLSRFRSIPYMGNLWSKSKMPQCCGARDEKEKRLSALLDNLF
jgi:hypothetical protein